MPTVSEAARVTTRDGTVWRTCQGCGVLAPLPPEVERCSGCESIPAQDATPSLTGRGRSR